MWLLTKHNTPYMGEKTDDCNFSAGARISTNLNCRATYPVGFDYSHNISALWVRMNAPQYKPGGAEWAKVEAIMKAANCSRLRAASALKVSVTTQRSHSTNPEQACSNDEAAALDSLSEALLISSIYSILSLIPHHVISNVSHQIL
jgi:hypothetical protein